MTDSFWEELRQHFDNLIPGIIVLTELWALGFPVPKLFKQVGVFEQGALFVAVCYALGLVAALFSRYFVDGVSQRRLRAIVFERFVHGGRKQLADYYRGIERGKGKDKVTKFDIDLEQEKKKGRRETVAEWNSIYRAALRNVDDARRDEVERRRAQGRLTRNLFFPIVIGTLFIPVPGFLRISCVIKIVLRLLYRVVLMMLGITVAFFMYAYAELNNMAEAHDISAVIREEQRNAGRKANTT